MLPREERLRMLLVLDNIMIIRSMRINSSKGRDKGRECMGGCEKKSVYDEKLEVGSAVRSFFYSSTGLLYVHFAHHPIPE